MAQVQFQCPICISPVTEPRSTPSGHIYCRKCIEQCINVNPYRAFSPITKKALKISDLRQIHADFVSDFAGTIQTKAQTQTNPSSADAVASASASSAPTAPPDIVLLLDVSGSMSEPSKANGDNEVPSRISLLVHTSKILKKACELYNRKLHIYTYSNSCRPIVGDLMDIKAGGQTMMDIALKVALDNHGKTAIYILVTDGEPTNSIAGVIKTYEGVWLNYILFGSGGDVKITNTISQLHEKNVVAHVQDVRSIIAYTIPMLTYIFCDGKSATLSEADELTRAEFVERISRSYQQSNLGSNIESIKSWLMGLPPTAYILDLLKDLCTDPDHSRISQSVATRKDFETYGKFFLPCAINAHRRKIPFNSYDASLVHYQTPEYQETYLKILDSCKDITYESIEQQQALSSGNYAAANYYASNSASQNRAVSNAYSSAYNYSTYVSSSDNDGCIAPDAVVTTPDKLTTMNLLKPGDLVATDLKGNYDEILYIVKIENLCGTEPIKTYNGLTPHHPVHLKDSWIFAEDACEQEQARYYPADTVVYDVVLKTSGTMVVNGCVVACLGYPVPNLVHPYYGTEKVVKEIAERATNGIVTTKGSNILHDAQGLVVTLFRNQKLETRN